MKKDFLKNKKITGVFATIAFIGGFVLTDKGLTGNVISETSKFSGTTSIIGVGLLACSLLLTLYTVKRE